MSSIENENDYYKLLGIEKNANVDEIKKVYKKLAIKYHPDKNQGLSVDEKKVCEDKFKKITEAYSVLSDSDKRKQYDMYGKVDGAANFDFSNIFNNIFGGGGGIFGNGGGGDDGIFNMFEMFGNGIFGGSGRGGRRMKGENITCRLPLTLEEIYCGCEKSINYERNVLCDKCKGPSKCGTCNGNGRLIEMRPLGPPGIIAQIQRVCDKCNGSGKMYTGCSSCSIGSGIRTITVVKRVVIENGTSNYTILYNGEGHEIVDGDNGDLCIFIEEVKHQYFERDVKNINDLNMRKIISLKEALIGFSFPIKTLDGRTLNINSKRGKNIIVPYTVKKVKGEGMRKNGSLNITFEIEFPQSLNEKQMEYISLAFN